MKICLIYSLSLLLLTSCATIWNKPTTKINVYSEKKTKLKVNNINYEFENECQIEVERTKDTLTLEAESDSIRKIITLKPINSFAYVSNIFYNYGLGMIVEKNNLKRYAYQGNVFINYNSKKKNPDRFVPSKKGQINLNISLPYINSFSLNPILENRKTSIGFWGISGGIDYSYSRGRFISLKTGAITDFFIPVPAAVDFEGEVDFMYSSYYSLSDYIEIRDFTIGYGLNYAVNTWDHRFYGDFLTEKPLRDPVKKNQNLSDLPLMDITGLLGISI